MPSAIPKAEELNTNDVDPLPPLVILAVMPVVIESAVPAEIIISVTSEKVPWPALMPIENVPDEVEVLNICLTL